MLRGIYTVISVWAPECFVFIVDAYRDLQMSKGPTFHGAGRTHSVSPSGDNSGDSGRTRVVTTRCNNNFCHLHHGRTAPAHDEDDGQGSRKIHAPAPLFLILLCTVPSLLSIFHDFIAIHGVPLFPPPSGPPTMAYLAHTIGHYSLCVACLSLPCSGFSHT